MQIRICKDWQHYRAGQILTLPDQVADALVFFGVAEDSAAVAKRIDATAARAGGGAESSARELLERKIETLDAEARAKMDELKDDMSEEEIEQLQREHVVICDELTAHRRALQILDSINTQ
ncbi:MAG: hypothetical protein ACR650_00160 [Methylocystis sp.]